MVDTQPANTLGPQPEGGLWTAQWCGGTGVSRERKTQRHFGEDWGLAAGVGFPHAVRRETLEPTEPIVFHGCVGVTWSPSPGKHRQTPLHARAEKHGARGGGNTRSFGQGLIAVLGNGRRPPAAGNVGGGSLLRSMMADPSVSHRFTREKRNGKQGNKRPSDQS